MFKWCVKKVAIISFLLVALGGCAAKQPHMTREEWLNLTSREYKGVSKEQALSAAERLLTLADGDDFKIMHTQEGLYANRNWMVYMVLAAVSGIDYWSVRATPIQSGVMLSLQVNRQMSTIAPMGTAAGDWAASSMPMGGTPVEGAAIYDLFWARMDYLLGKRSDWMTCEAANLRIKEKKVWGDNEPLCNSFNVKDEEPVAPLSTN